MFCGDRQCSVAIELCSMAIAQCSMAIEQCFMAMEQCSAMGQCLRLMFDESQGEVGVEALGQSQEVWRPQAFRVSPRAVAQGVE